MKTSIGLHRQFDLRCNAGTHTCPMRMPLDAILLTTQSPNLQDPCLSAHGRSRSSKLFSVLDQFEQLTQEKRRHSTNSLLKQLNSDYGIAWNEIAKVAGISRQAVRKWRDGQATPDDRRFTTLYKLTAFAELVMCGDGDPSQWLRMPLRISEEVTPRLSVADVLATGNFVSAVRHFNAELTDRNVLRSVFPGYSSGSEGLATIEVDEGVFVISLDQLGLVTEDADIEKARTDLLLQVREYIVDWHDLLRFEEPHRSRALLVLKLEEADQNLALDTILFGR